VTGRGIVAGYTARFWLLVVVLGVVTGVSASALMGILALVEHLAYGGRQEGFLYVASSASHLRRLAAVVLAAPVLWLGIYLLGRIPATGGGEVSESIWLRAGHMKLIPSFGRAVLSIVTVGMGVSLGREAAPQLAGAASASRLAEWAGLPRWQRRLLVASAAGAGFAAVYNVPLGGALFALEVLLGSLALPLVLPALAVSVVATVVAWTTLGTAHTYHMPNWDLHPAQLVWAFICGPLIGLAAVGWVKMVEQASRMRPRHRGRYWAPLFAFTGLGLLAIPYPELLGNGKGVVQLVLTGGISIGLAAVLLALKPLVTAACLAAGSPGGLFTPTLTIGALLTAVLAGVWAHIWPQALPASYALIGAGAFLAAAMQAPLAGTVLVLELSRHFDTLMAPALIAVCVATVVARRIGAPSIYSARLRPQPHAAGGIQEPWIIEALQSGSHSGVSLGEAVQTKNSAGPDQASDAQSVAGATHGSPRVDQAARRSSSSPEL
jgi:H+/Cl- antiporter ClcA